MFLNELNDEEKKIFLELAHHVARVDGKFVSQEEMTIYNYCKEMKIPDIEYKNESFDIEIAIQQISDKRSQRIFLMEILALIYSDEIYHPKENIVIEKMLSEFCIDSNLKVIYSQWAKNAISVQFQGSALINL